MAKRRFGDPRYPSRACGPHVFENRPLRRLVAQANLVPRWLAQDSQEEVLRPQKDPNYLWRACGKHVFENRPLGQLLIKPKRQKLQSRRQTPKPPGVRWSPTFSSNQGIRLKHFWQAIFGRPTECARPSKRPKSDTPLSCLPSEAGRRIASPQGGSPPSARCFVQCALMLADLRLNRHMRF